MAGGDVLACCAKLRDEAEISTGSCSNPRNSHHGAVRGTRPRLQDINLLAFKLASRPGDLLVTFSCSGGVRADLFQKSSPGAALDAGVDARIVDWLHAAPDHPVALDFPEGEYLKGLLLRARPATMTAQRTPIPVTLLTGYLGAARPRCLADARRMRNWPTRRAGKTSSARSALDHHIVSAVSDHVVLLGNGCICCAVQDELVNALDDLYLKRMRARCRQFRRCADRDFGLADPAPLLNRWRATA